MELNNCQAGHAYHSSRLIESFYGPIWIWDWSQYMDQPLYCTAQDEVSKSIDVNGYWEKPETERVRQILKEKPGLVVDLGAHIGWFTMQALSLGCEVHAVEADPENVWLLDQNVRLIERESRRPISVICGWVHEQPPLTDDHIRLLKIDIEGRESDGIDYTRTLWENRQIDYALIEISPIFHAGYPELVDELRGYGYQASVFKQEGDWIVTGADCTFDQETCLFTRL